MSAHQLNSRTRAAKSFGEQFNQRSICRRIYGRRRDFDPKLASQHTIDFIARSSWLHFHGKHNAIGVFA